MLWGAFTVLWIPKCCIPVFFCFLLFSNIGVLYWIAWLSTKYVRSELRIVNLDSIPFGGGWFIHSFIHSLKFFMCCTFSTSFGPIASIFYQTQNQIWSECYCSELTDSFVALAYPFCFLVKLFRSFQNEKIHLSFAQSTFGTLDVREWSSQSSWQLVLAKTTNINETLNSLCDCIMVIVLCIVEWF